MENAQEAKPQDTEPTFIPLDECGYDLTAHSLRKAIEVAGARKAIPKTLLAPHDIFGRIRQYGEWTACEACKKVHALWPMEIRVTCEQYSIELVETPKGLLSVDAWILVCDTCIIWSPGA